MGIRLSVPKIHGQDTTVFSGWPSFIQHRQKCLHLECAGEEVEFLQDLFKPAEIKNMSKYFCSHGNYHFSMIYCGLEVVVVLGRQQPFYSVNNPLIQVGSMSLRHVLYHHMKLAEGYSLIAEVHQES